MQKFLLVFNGPPGVGKTFFIRFLLTVYPRIFAAVRSPTTRDPRSEDDRQFFDFLSHAAFGAGVEEGLITPSGDFRGERYGLYVDRTRKVLETRHGLIALTQEGIETYARDPGIRGCIRVVALRPASKTVLVENLMARGVPLERLEEELARAETHAYPESPDAMLTLLGKRNNLFAHARYLFRQLRLDPLL